jgi:hypothetical protein
MCVWSLPKVFHTCGKNCGNSIGSGLLMSPKAAIWRVSRQAKVTKRDKLALPGQRECKNAENCRAA